MHFFFDGVAIMLLTFLENNKGKESLTHNHKSPPHSKFRNATTMSYTMGADKTISCVVAAFI